MAKIKRKTDGTFTLRMTKEEMNALFWTIDASRPSVIITARMSGTAREIENLLASAMRDS